MSVPSSVGSRNVVINPFELGDTARMIAAEDPAVAIDAQFVTGGYPRLCAEWRGAADAMTFLLRQLGDENSELVDVGRNVLDRRVPAGSASHPRPSCDRIRGTYFQGDRRPFRYRRTAAGPFRWEILTTVKRVVSADRPMSLKSGNDPRYRVADSYLRFWLRFIEPSLPDIARGRPDLALARVRESGGKFRGRAVEPIIRASVERLVADDPGSGRYSGSRRLLDQEHHS